MNPLVALERFLIIQGAQPHKVTLITVHQQNPATRLAENHGKYVFDVPLVSALAREDIIVVII